MLSISCLCNPTTGCLKTTPEFSCITEIAVTFIPCNGFTNCFFSLKLRSICKFWIQNHIRARFGCWDIRKTKCGSEVDKFKFTLAGISTCSLRFNEDKCCLDKCNFDSCLLLREAPKTILLKFGQNQRSKGSCKYDVSALWGSIKC